MLDTRQFIRGTELSHSSPVHVQVQANNTSIKHDSTGFFGRWAVHHNHLSITAGRCSKRKISITRRRMPMAAFPLPCVPAMPRISCYRTNTLPTGRCLSCNYSTPKNGVVTAQVVDLTAARKVDIPFQQGSGAAEEYIKEIERIVNVTFPVSSRIRYVGGNVWRARLKPITFFTVTATPFCDLEVFHKENSVHIQSNKLVLDFIGVAGQYADLDLNFCLRGELIVQKKPSPVARNEESPRFLGWVKMGLNVDLPLPFCLMPDAIVVPVGNGILDRILGAMEGALVSRISRDYNTWCQKSSNQQPTTNP